MAGSECVTMMVLANADVKGGEKAYLFTEAFLKKEKKVVNVQAPMKFKQYLLADKFVMCQRVQTGIFVRLFEQSQVSSVLFPFGRDGAS